MRDLRGLSRVGEELPCDGVRERRPTSLSLAFLSSFVAEEYCFCFSKDTACDCRRRQYRGSSEVKCQAFTLSAL
jgi:hypothetical protein